MQEGFIDYKSFKTYYQIYSDESCAKTPLLALHGGPGSSHHYLLGLRKLTNTNRSVILYDQFGSGQSEGRAEKQLWNVQTFVEQVDAVRRELGLSDIHLLGHSWGGMLAIEYLPTNPTGVHSVILSSTMIDMPLYQEEATKLVAELPPETRAVIKQHERNGTVNDPEYKQAFKAYNEAHIFRGTQWPQEVATPKGAFNAELYHTMWGWDEAYTSNGTLRAWSRLEALGQIKLPVLITSGEYDELTPRQAHITQERIPGSELVIFKGASHCHHVEEEQAYLKTVSQFMDKHDA